MNHLALGVQGSVQFEFSCREILPFCPGGPDVYSVSGLLSASWNLYVAGFYNRAREARATADWSRMAAYRGGWLWVSYGVAGRSLRRLEGGDSFSGAGVCAVRLRIVPGLEPVALRIRCCGLRLLSAHCAKYTLTNTARAWRSHRDRLCFFLNPRNKI